jgi:protein gp37
LLQTPAAVRFVSVEPMLEPVDLAQWLSRDCEDCNGFGIEIGPEARVCDSCHGERRWHGVDWVIAGCESGPRRRPAELDWFRSLRNQCVSASVPYFLKQMEDATDDHPVLHMPELDEQVWAQFPGVTP